MNRTVLLAFALWILPEGILFAQRGEPSSPFMLKVDYGRFYLDESKIYLEIYYSLYPRQLSYETKDGRLSGNVYMTTQLRNKKTNEMVVDRPSLIPVSVADSSEQTLPQTIVTQVGYAISFGEYELFVLAYDSLRKDRRDSVTMPVGAPPFVKELTTSDVVLCSNITSSQNQSDLFYKNTFEVVPNPTLVFGVTTHPVVFHYLEIYNILPETSYTIRTDVIDGGGKVVRTSSKPRKYGMKKAVEVGMVNVSSFPSGRYTFQMSILDESQKVNTQPQKTFFVYNPHVKTPEVSGIHAVGSQFVAMSAEEIVNEFRKAQYVATDKEISTFAKISSVDGQREFLSNFWKDVELGKTGRPPITRAEYLRRVSIVNERYRVFSKAGWQSDQGRVYILYGDPDEIERVPSSESSRPYETWHYYQIENGVLFVFIDRTGFRSYDLVHSTKRGEIYDEQWQRQLH